jgi:hypothetical protein
MQLTAFRRHLSRSRGMQPQLSEAQAPRLDQDVHDATPKRRSQRISGLNRDSGDVGCLVRQTQLTIGQTAHDYWP